MYIVLGVLFQQLAVVTMIIKMILFLYFVATSPTWMVTTKCALGPGASRRAVQISQL